MQTRAQTLIEVHCNTAIGFVGSYAITALSLAVFKWMDAWTLGMVITVLCTIWSIVRGYFIRRYFAHRHAR